ncbi:MAG: hypothetical protein MUQ32_16210, partial [Chloroflexi bacterium]|nr:hypothetical protein [Chloroflexota bacterium]
MSPDPGDQEAPASSLLAAPSPNPAGARAGRDAWLTPGVRGIGLASLFADLGHEIPTALMASFMTSVLGAP